MRLRLQVFVGLVFVLLLTMLGAWTLAAGIVFRPLVRELNTERVAVAVHLAELAERPRAKRHKVQALSEDLGLSVRVVDDIPADKRARATVYERHGRQVLVIPGRDAPVAVEFERPPGEQRWLVVEFQANLQQPRSRIAFGLILLTIAGVFLAFVVVRNIFRPLEIATSGMQRVAAGELSHRISTEGAVGDVARTFNTMADRVQGLVTGQRDLMAAVSHELRTPLTRMRLMLEMLPESTDPATRIAALTKDVDEVDSLVGELLESSRLHQGVLALEYDEVSPERVVYRALGSVDLGDRTIELSGLDHAPVLADERRLMRCMTNLLSNVGRYTPADCTVRIFVEDDADLTWFVVEDTGTGVSKADRERLFDPFFRAEGSRSKATGGLGLGLMLVQQIAEAHGGRAEALEGTEGGLCVRVGIPGDGPGD